METENREKTITIRALVKEKDDEIGRLSDMYQHMQNNRTSWRKIAQELSLRYSVAIHVPHEGH